MRLIVPTGPDRLHIPKTGVLHRDNQPDRTRQNCHFPGRCFGDKPSPSATGLSLDTPRSPLKQNHNHRPLLRSLNDHRSYHRKTQETLLARPHHRSRPRSWCQICLLVRVFLHLSFTECSDKSHFRCGFHLKSCKPKHPSPFFYRRILTRSVFSPETRRILLQARTSQEG